MATELPPSAEPGAVSREHFAGVNERLGMQQLRAFDYFRPSVASFPRSGVEPMYFTYAIPQIVRSKTGLPVAQVAYT
jgi:hypothetical protein